jgi:uncharacterized protein (DUF1778 family)
MAQSRAKSGDATARSLINLRVTAEDRRLIDRAAASRGKNRSEFMLDAARQAAEDALLDRVLFRTDARTFDQLLDVLDAPAQPNPGLQRLLATKPPWEP